VTISADQVPPDGWICYYCHMHRVHFTRQAIITTIIRMVG